MNLKNEFELTHLVRCASTQEKAWELATLHNTAHVVVADEQTHGRGRRGNSWLAHPERSLAFSVAFSSVRAKSYLNLLPLMAASALWNFVSRKCKIKLDFKWPNDLGVYRKNFHKCAGILVEVKQTHVVIGWGVNVLAPAPYMGAVALADIGRIRSFERPVWARAIVAEFFAHARSAESPTMDFEDSLLEYFSTERLQAMRGREVAAGWGSGRVVALARRGSLLIESPDGRLVTVFSGDLQT